MTMNDRRSNVVHLETERDDGAVRRPLPAPFGRLVECIQPAFSMLLQKLFDQVDDSLFELADKATSNAEQNMYFESMREVRIKRRGIENSTIRNLGGGLQSLAYGEIGRLLAPRASVTELSASGLSLIENDELEEMVAVDSMVAKARAQFGKELDLLSTRLDSLVNRLDVDSDTNPLGPAAVCQAFLEACRSLELDIKAKLVLFKLFERHVVSGLGEVYQRCNLVLREEGILPGLRAGQPQRETVDRRPQRQAAPARPAASQQIALEELHTLLVNAREVSGSGYGLVAAGAAPSLPQNALFQLLQEVQQQQLAQLAAGDLPTTTSMDVYRALNQLVAQRMPSKAVSIAQLDEDAINLVSMLFQFILEDRNLAAPMKAMLARLQIPILKLAMQDRSFFSRGGHPARKLLNEMATAALGWTPSERTERDPLFNKIESVVNRVIDRFEDDSAVFQDALADFVAFVEMERRRTRLVEQRIIDAEDGKAKSEAARAKVQALIARECEGRNLPAPVLELIDKGWSNVLFLAALKDGLDSADGAEHVATLRDLVASVDDLKTPEDRPRLLQAVPALLKRLRAGLIRVGFSPHDMGRLFAELEHIHLAKLRTVAPDTTGVASADGVAAQPGREPDRKPSVDAALAARHVDAALSSLDSELDVLDTGLDTPAPGSSAAAMADMTEMAAEVPTLTETPDMPAAELIDVEQARERVLALKPNQWVEFRRNAGQRLRCRLAAVIRATGKYIFVNRAGVKVAEENVESLTALMAANQLMVLDDGLLFDRALEAVIGNLRQMKSGPAGKQ